MHRTGLARLSAVACILWTGASETPSSPPTAGVPATAGEVTLRQTTLGPMPTDLRNLSITPDGSRVALVANAGSRQVVFIDGNEGPAYSTIVQTSSSSQGQAPTRLLMISADSSRVAYVATKGPSDSVMVLNQKEGPVFEGIRFAKFSPVGHRLAYIGTKGGKQYVVTDAALSAGYGAVMPNELGFSADGQHVGYTASTGEAQNPWRVVVDGKEGPGFMNVSRLQFSEEGGHYAYIAQPANNVEENQVVMDDKVGPKVGIVQSLTLSKDGKHVAYVAPQSSKPPLKWVAFIDGEAGPGFERVSNIVLSPDGAHTAYAGGDSSTGHVSTYAMVDGKKSLDYLDCSGFLFSADSKHLAYLATASNQKVVVVLDGRESDAHDAVDASTLKFSPDGTRLAYVVTDQGSQHAVVDGKVGPASGLIDGRSFQFSPDGQHYRYKIRGNSGAWTVVMDDLPSSATPAPSELVTTADGRHSAAVVIKDFESSVQSAQVLLDGKPVGGTFSRVDQLQICADGTRVAFIANYPPDAGKPLTYAVLGGSDGVRDGPGARRIERVLLSPDGQHVAYAATEEGTNHYVVVDAFRGPAYEQVFPGLTDRFEGLQFRPDGSLEFLAVMDKKLQHIALSGDAIRSLPKPVDPKAPGSPGYSQLYAFGQVENDGAKPFVLTAAADGTLFGATTAGGEFRKGVLFTLKPDGSGYKILRSFEGGQGDGSYASSLWVAPDGALIGSLTNEGPRGHGAIFRAAADGSAYTLVHPFTGGDKDGGAPDILVMDVDGTLYGLTCRGGGRAPLHLFRMKPDGSEFTLVYNAPETPGANDQGIGPFTDGGDGWFYGVAGQNVFKIKKDGSGYAIVRKFQGPPHDIHSADRAPILGADRMLYGLASSGGKSTGGVLYKLARDGSGYSMFLDPAEVLQPRALAEGPDGKLYVLARQGLVRVNKDGGEFTVLHEMDGGFFPWTALVRNGVFYGITAQGNKGGCVFRYGLGGGGSGATEPTVVFQPVPPTPLDPNVEVPPAAHQ
jgi:WD40 repeat protein